MEELLYVAAEQLSRPARISLDSVAVDELQKCNLAMDGWSE